MSKQVQDLMTTDVAQLEMDRPVADAARAMRDRDVGGVLVTRSGKVSGILTDRDIVVRCIAEDKDPGSTRLESICSDEVATLSPEASSDEAVKMMREKAIRRVAIVEDDQPRGMLSIGDLARDRDRHSALGQISAAPPNR